MPKNGQINPVIESVGFFLDNILKDNPNHINIFRGESKDFTSTSYTPSLYREQFDNEKKLEIEKGLLRQLIHRKPILELKTNHFFDYLIFGQHHGLKTRLLDWSLNPLTALFFACNANMEEDGYVYMKDSNTLSDAIQEYWKYQADERNVFNFFQFLGSLEFPLLLRPSPLFPRLINQQGVFTVFPNPQRSPYHIHQQFQIPAQNKEKILNQLSVMGVNEWSIFQDQDSLCRTIYQEVSKKPELYSNDSNDPATKAFFLD